MLGVFIPRRFFNWFEGICTIMSNMLNYNRLVNLSQ